MSVTRPMTLELVYPIAWSDWELRVSLEYRRIIEARQVLTRALVEQSRIVASIDVEQGVDDDQVKAIAKLHRIMHGLDQLVVEWDLNVDTEIAALDWQGDDRG